MGILSEFPGLVQDIFLTKEKNNAGIYALRFYVRGKPWVVTVDDAVLTEYRNGMWIEKYASIGKN